VQDELVVSFLHLPAYVGDEQIENKLKQLGVEIIGQIKRRVYPNTDIVDGTRHVKVRFPPTIKSLPYSMKFHDGESYAYYRVIHNKQVKVCNNCMSDQHVFRECPENRCFKCSDFGHLSRNCVALKCQDCGKFGARCLCVNGSLHYESDGQERAPAGFGVIVRCAKCDMQEAACTCEQHTGLIENTGVGCVPPASYMHEIRDSGEEDYSESEDGWREGENGACDESSVNSEDVRDYVIEDERRNVQENDTEGTREDVGREVAHSGGEDREEEDEVMNEDNTINFQVIRKTSVKCVDIKNNESVKDTSAGVTCSTSISVDVEPSTMDWNVVPGKSRRRKRLDIKPNVDAPRISVKKLKTNVNANTKK
jgi:hypothetical protein